ncbi:MAG: LPP20 family lipoprotein [Bacteroidales bacterium]
MKKLILLSIVLISIGVNAQNFVTSIPDWYDNPPKSSRKFYGAGVGTSRTIDVAESKALLDAKTKIAEQVGTVKYDNKKVTTKVGVNGKQQETVQSKQIEAELTDVRLIKKAVMQDGESYTVYVLCEMKRRK